MSEESTVIPPDTRKIVDDTVNRLMEHFDTVQVLVTKHGDQGETTASYERGLGNIYARIGHAKEWIIIMDEYTREWASRNARKPPDDD